MGRREKMVVSMYESPRTYNKQIEISKVTVFIAVISHSVGTDVCSSTPSAMFALPEA